MNGEYRVYTAVIRLLSLYSDGLPLSEIIPFVELPESYIDNIDAVESVLDSYAAKESSGIMCIQLQGKKVYKFKDPKVEVNFYNSTPNAQN